MQVKKIFQRTFLGVAVIGSLLFLSVIFFVPNMAGPIKTDLALLVENAISLVVPEKVEYGLPVHLKIPNINVDTAFEYVGVAPDGTMDIPKGPVNVGWFKFGPHPGEKGSAVIAGHFGWYNNIPAVFDDLYKLKKGDKIYVEDEKGQTATFVVRETAEYKPEADTSNVFGSNDGKAHLNLITCQGNWNTASQSRPKRLVVFTDKE